MFINWATVKQLFAANTLFEERMENKKTYQAPGKYDPGRAKKQGAVAQLDYIMINSNYKKAVINAKSDYSKNLDSDHFPVTATVQCKFKKPTKKQTKMVTAYATKQTELDKVDMNNFFAEHLEKSQSTNYEAWQRT